jgi:hypothetical protein
MITSTGRHSLTSILQRVAFSLWPRLLRRPSSPALPAPPPPPPGDSRPLIHMSGGATSSPGSPPASSATPPACGGGGLRLREGVMDRRCTSPWTFSSLELYPPAQNRVRARGRQSVAFVPPGESHPLGLTRTKACMRSNQVPNGSADPPRGHAGQPPIDNQVQSGVTNGNGAWCKGRSARGVTQAERRELGSWGAVGRE